MVLDTSAIIAAIADEPDGACFQQAMLGAVSLTISSVTVLETRIVLQSRHGDKAVHEFDEMLDLPVSLSCRSMQKWPRQLFKLSGDMERGEAIRLS
jgi:uncharacterized protein with PIN domain